MKHADFVHLHTHTQYSLLDGAIRPDDLFKKAKQYKMQALAITDHGNMYGSIEFYQKARESGIKPIIGCEVYVAAGSRFDKDHRAGSRSAYHLVLLAQNHTGYKNLVYLVSKGFLEGFYYHPRIDKELLKTHNEGLIALSACLHGELPTLITNNAKEKALKVAEEYSAIFKDRRFYLEIQENKIPEQQHVNKGLIEISKELSLPLVATNDSHYLKKEDARAHEILLCLQTSKKLSDPDRMKFSTDEFYLKSPQEMIELFSYAPESIKNTIEIAERCNLEINFDTIHYPEFQTPGKVNINDYFDNLAKEGLRERLRQYENKKDFNELSQRYTKRLDEELKIIKATGYPNYFLTVSDFINHAKKNSIPVGPGRGSAAGSLVAYALKITNVDPIIYGLLFERFLNPERVSQPDIDIDFCKERRDEMINYVTNKYGEENVAQIITFGKMKARGVIRDVARVLDLPYKEADKIAKLIPNTPDIKLSEALAQEPKLSEMMEKDQRIKDLFSLSLALEGLPRHASTHAAGVVISDKPLIGYLPLRRGTKDEIITQYAMKDVEKIGLIKYDFLGLKTLTVIKNCLDIINEHIPEPINIDYIPLDDQEVFRLLSRGETEGIFQLESTGMKELVVKLKPENMEDLIALLALYRPGPLGSGMVDDFIKRKRGDVAIPYELPQLKDILADTYGVILYQEQVMQIASRLANFSLGDADLLRKAMGKKILDVMESQKEKFLNGAKGNSINPKKAEKIFNQMAKFAEYGFNKSHSTAYALIAYQTAYLKAHHPVEFMAALLTCEMDNHEKVLKHMNECREMKIDVLPPDINESNRDFTAFKKNIRFGLAAVKNVGGAAIESIIDNRNKSGNYTSIFPFCSENDLRKVNRRVIESLIKCGAFDFTGAHRSQMLAGLDRAIELAQQFQKDRNSKQTSMFDIFASDEKGTVKEEALPELPEWSDEELLSYEKEALGFYISKHPLSRFEEYLAKYTNTDTLTIHNQSNDTVVNIGGIKNKSREITTRKGDRMCFLTLEDLKGVIEVVIFADLYKSCSELLKSDQPLLVAGKVDTYGDTLKIVASQITPLSEADKVSSPNIHLTLNIGEINKSHLQLLRKLCLTYPGDSHTFLHLVAPQKSETIISLGNSYKVDPSPQFANEIKRLFGNTAQLTH